MLSEDDLVRGYSGQAPPDTTVYEVYFDREEEGWYILATLFERVAAEAVLAAIHADLPLLKADSYYGVGIRERKISKVKASGDLRSVIKAALTEMADTMYDDDLSQFRPIPDEPEDDPEAPVVAPGQLPLTP